MARIEVLSEVAGNVWKILLMGGEKVEQGDVIMILESMKMEIPVEAEMDGKLLEICVAQEEQVEEDQVLAIVEY